MVAHYLLNHGIRVFARRGAAWAVMASAVLVAAGSACAQMVQWQSLSDVATPRIEGVETTFLHFTSSALKESVRDGWREENSTKLVQQQDCLWATSIVAEMDVTVTKPRERMLAVTMRPHAIPAIDPQRVEVLWNGGFLGICSFEKDKGWAFERFVMPVPPVLQRAGVNTITFLSRFALSARDVGRGGDKADASRVAFGLRAVQLLEPGQEPVNAVEDTALPEQANSLAQLDGHTFTQQAGGWVTTPVFPPLARRFLFRCAKEGTEPAGGTILARWDTLDGAFSQKLEYTEVVEGDRTWLESDLSFATGRHFELIFDTTANEPGQVSTWAEPGLWLEDRRPEPEPTPENYTLGAPNKVVVVVLDALRASGLGCGGAMRQVSPFIDEVARGAILYERAYSAASWTYPSVISILTGRFPLAHGVHWVDEVLPTEVPTLQETLQASGIATGCVAENPFFDLRYKLNRGFDFYESVTPGQAMGEERHSGEVTAKAIDFMTAHKDSRFFLYVHYFPPHAPYAKANTYDQSMTYDPILLVPSEDEAMHEAEVGRRAVTRESIKQLRARYDENVRYGDDQVRELLAGMKALGLGEDTAIVIMSDHGESFLEHGSIGHSDIPYDPQIHVPFIVQFGPDPKAPGANERRKRPIRTVDLAPTVCAWFGVTPPEGLVGTPLTAPPTEEDERPFSIAESQSRPPFEAYIWDRFKLVQGADGRFEVYDLSMDPGERSNLADLRPVLADYLKARALAWRAQLVSGAVHPAAKAETTDEANENLKALGYLQ